MTVREIYRLHHQKAVGFNRACSRVIEQLVAQRGECTDKEISCCVDFIDCDCF